MSPPNVIVPPFPDAASAQPAQQEAPPEPSLAQRLLHSTTVTALFFATCYLLPHYKLLGAPVFTSLPLFVLTCWALVKIAIDSTVTESFSQLVGKLPVIGPGLYDESDGPPTGLLSCPLCTGMWMGMILGALGARTFEIDAGLPAMLALVAHGLIGSGAAYLGHLVEDRLKSKA